MTDLHTPPDDRSRLHRDVHPLAFVAYFAGRQPFWRAVVAAFLALAIASLAYIGLAFHWLGSPAPESFAPLSRWAVVLLVAGVPGIVAMWQCSRNLHATSTRYAARGFVLFCAMTWGMLAFSLIRFIRAGYGN